MKLRGFRDVVVTLHTEAPLGDLSWRGRGQYYAVSGGPVNNFFFIAGGDQMRDPNAKTQDKMYRFKIMTMPLYFSMRDDKWQLLV